MSAHSTPLILQTLEPPEGARTGEPVTCGVPWPEGALLDARALRLVGADGREQPLQARALDRWPDGSVRWCLVDWLASSADSPQLVVGTVPDREPSSPLSARESEDGTWVVDTGVAKLALRPGGNFPFDSVVVDGAPVIEATRSGLVARDDAGCVYQAKVDTLRLEEAGPVRVALRANGYLVARGGSRLLDLEVRLHFFHESAVVRTDVAITNPRPAGHPGGMWSLGNDGSIYLRDLSLSLALPARDDRAEVRLSERPGVPLTPSEGPYELYQASSGGENWQSSAHVDRFGEIPMPFSGYRLRRGEGVENGDRATPIAQVHGGGSSLGVSAPEFWQNFPKALEAGPSGVILRLFPHQQESCHELQGGERKTHTCYLSFAHDHISESELEWTRNPTIAHASPEWYAASGAVPHLTPVGADSNAGYISLVGRALDGGDTLERKRERVDEYGWRHFGDVWADHEAARHEGATPLISHYNNQYDMVGGMSVQFLRSGDGRWHRQMCQLARHVVDIDVYHTDKDKSAYNGGMFWHTVHYIDAGPSTHRSYPRAEGVPGGGPSSGHLYAEGLWLYYLLTGDPDARAAVIGLGDYVVGADDGRQTIFRFLDRGPTGHVSNSGFDDYHGPGRSGANAISTLVTAHRASGDDRYLEKADELLRRCIHPEDNLEALDLLDADRKWFYTMFLQSLGGFLDYRAELGRIDEHYAYARAALLHYATWAAEHEYPYLEKPETLEFPTETWAAQDLRKSEMFRVAARHATGELRSRFLERARFFFDASIERLEREETRTFTRPIALLLSNGWRQAWFDQNDVEPAPPSLRERVDFGTPEPFVSQKRRALHKAKRLMVAAWAVAVLGLGATALSLWLSRG